MSNATIAEILQNIANLLELQNADHFRIVSYQRAAQTIRGYGKELVEIYQTDPAQLLSIPGIGKSLAEKITEIINTGTCQYYQELLGKTEPGLLEIMQLRDVGPKKTKLFYHELGIKNIDQLKQAIQSGKLSELPRMGEKSANKILTAIEDRATFKERILLHEALTIAENLIDYLKQHKACKQVSYAGSLRRRKETIGDIDLLATSDTAKNKTALAEHFLNYPATQRVLARGETKISVLLSNGRQVDLRILQTKSFGAALHYFTGSKEHNIRIRERARKMGLKVNEYGVYQGERWLAGRREEEVFAKVGLPYIEPEMREDQGEIELAEQQKLPKLIQLKDLKGDLQLHSNYTDGNATIADMATAAKAYGLEYMALTDHTKSLYVAGGLMEKQLETQYKKIDALNKQLKGFRILKSAEVDIKKDGSLDIADKTLAKMDSVLVSLHSSFTLDKDKQTKRVIKALENPYTCIFAHPTGRIINQRRPVEFDLEEIIKAAVANHVALEINGQPARLDLHDRHIRLAKSLGAKFVISSDSHSPSSFGYLFFGVAMARRGWLEKQDVLNTMSVDKLLAYFGRKTK